MTTLIILAVTGIIVGLIFKLLNEVRSIKSGHGVKNSVHGAHYRTRDAVMNKSEMAFFFDLQKKLPSGYYIFPNMRIADFIDAVDGEGFYNRRNKILPKHIDFLICDQYFKPVVAIEVNGSSHQRRDRVERDELVRKIFAEAKLPLEWVDVGTSFAESVGRVMSQLKP